MAEETGLSLALAEGRFSRVVAQLCCYMCAVLFFQISGSAYVAAMCYTSQLSNWWSVSVVEDLHYSGASTETHELGHS